MEHAEIVVIGAGIVGLAVARQLALQRREVLILESESRISSVTSARNSGVIHAGIHYPIGTLKAQFCVKGRQALYRYAEERRIPYKRCGKLIVAADDLQIMRLREIKKRAEGNGVPDLSFLTPAELRECEPEVVAVAALRSPSTGIIDVHELAQSLLGDAEANGAILALNTAVAGVQIDDERFLLEVRDADGTRFGCRYLVNAAGLGAQQIARHMTGLDPATVPGQILAKGNYFSLSGRQPFQTLVYPLPEPGGLGIHATIDMAGRVRFGPDVERISEIDYTVDPSRASRFCEAISVYWPGVAERSLYPDYAGVRPKIPGEGASDADFMVQGERDHGVPRLVNLYGIESPGLTAALELATHVSRLLLGPVWRP